MDNIFVERLRRSVKYEEVYLKDYENVQAASASLDRYFRYYNGERLHQSLEYRTPKAVYFGMLSPLHSGVGEMTRTGTRS